MLNLPFLCRITSSVISVWLWYHLKYCTVAPSDIPSAAHEIVNVPLTIGWGGEGGRSTTVVTAAKEKGIISSWKVQMGHFSSQLYGTIVTCSARLQLVYLVLRRKSCRWKASATQIDRTIPFFSHWHRHVKCLGDSRSQRIASVVVCRCISCVWCYDARTYADLWVCTI